MAATEPHRFVDIDSVRQALEELEASDPEAFVAALGQLVQERLASNRWSHPSVRAFSRVLRDAAAMQQSIFVLHDTRSMVGALEVFMHMCRQDLERLVAHVPRGTPEMARAVANIQKAFSDMGSSITHIMEVSYDAPGSNRHSMAPAKFSDALGRTARIVRRSVKIPIELDRAPDIKVRSPEADLVRVLNNLVGNSARALRNQRDGRIAIRAWASATTAFVEVWDNGPGLPEGEREKVFDLFHTTKSTGGGVGLASCRALVERWGGTIDVESSKEGGTTFRFSIPVV